MKQTSFRKIAYHIQHRYLTLNNVVICVAFLIAAGFVWGSLSVMERNYTLQRNLDRKNQTLQISELQVRNLELERAYYHTSEYQELAVRERLGLAHSGEHELILPRPSNNSHSADIANDERPREPTPSPSNAEQWIDFLFGTNRSRLQ